MEKIVFVNSRGEQIELFHKPFFLMKAEGLSGVETQLFTSKVAGQHGETLHGQSMGMRDIGLEIAIIAKDDKELYMLRRRLNKVLNPVLGKGYLYYSNDYGTWKLGVNTINAPICGEKTAASVEVRINMSATDPFWRSINDKHNSIALWVGDFEFPLEIHQEGIIMGHKISTYIVNIYNSGDTDCGMIIRFVAKNGKVKNPNLLNVKTREYIKINKVLEVGDILEINTNFYNKKVELIRQGECSNAFHFIDLNSVFLSLHVGDNLLRYNADEGLDALEVDIYHTDRYVGI